MSKADALRFRVLSAWPIVGLALAELRRSRWAKLAWAGALVPAGIVLAGASAARGHAAPTAALSSLSSLVAWSTWTCGGTLAFAASEDPFSGDPSGGLRWLLAERGVSDRAYRFARTAASFLELVLRLASTWVAALLLLALALPAWSLTRLVVPIFGYSLGVAVVLAGLASGCAAAGTGRGRSLFVALLLLPWLISRGWYGAPLSVPGLLDAMWTWLASMPPAPGGTS